MRILRPSRGRSPRAAVLCGSFAAAALTALPAAGAPAPPAAGAPAPVKLVEGDVALEMKPGPGTASCPGEDALRERAADVFEFRDPFVPRGATAAASVRIEITRKARAYRGVISTLDAGGEVTAVATEEHVDCDALVWVLAHRVALAILPRPAPAPAPPAPQPLAPVAPPPQALPAPPRCDEACRADLARRISTERVKFSPSSSTLAAGGLLTMALTPEAGAGVWAGANVRAGSFSVWLEGRIRLPARAMILAPGLTSHVYSVSGVLSPCMRIKRAFSGCAIAEFGQIAYQLPDKLGTIGRPLFAVGPRLCLDVPLPFGAALRASVDLAVHPYTPSFSALLGDADDAPLATWEMPRVSGVLSVGFTWST